MTDTYFMTQVLGFITGTALSGLLLVLVWRAEKLGAKSHQGSLTVFLALVWNAGSLVRYASLLMGFESAADWANAFAYSATAVLPTAGLQLLQQSKSSWRHSIGTVVKYVSLVIGATLTLVLFAAIIIPEFTYPFSTLTELTAYNLIFHLVIVFLLFRGDIQAKDRVRTFTNFLLVTMGILSIGLLLSFFFPLGPTAKDVMESLTQQATIPMMIATFAFLAQFHFADVFVKRSLTILASVLVVLIYSSLIVIPLAGWLGATAQRPKPAVLIAGTILWCVPILLFPLFERAIKRAADRWVFRRPDYRQLVLRFSRDIGRATDQAELSTEAARVIQDAIGAGEVRIISVEPTSVDLRAPMDKSLVCFNRTRSSFQPEPSFNFQLPIYVGSALTHLLSVVPHALSRKLLSEEIAFLQALADQIGRRLEALQFEFDRNAQQLREARLRELVTASELKALRAQINPHFLFNTLNTILDLITVEPKKAELMTERLADVFRYMLARSARSFVAVREEFEFLTTYLQIEQARFGNRLRVQITIDPGMVDELVPPLILQPLVENALKHGLSPKPSGGSLHVRAEHNAGSLRFIVEDDGVGWRDNLRGTNPPAERGIGFRNVVDRLQLLYGDAAHLGISSSSEKGTRVTICLPKNESQNPDHRRRDFSAISSTQTAQCLS